MKTRKRIHRLMWFGSGLVVLILVVAAHAQTTSLRGAIPGSPPGAGSFPAAQEAASVQAASPKCDNTNTVVSDVVALDQPFMLNRLGAAYPQGTVFALRQDVISTDSSTAMQPGKVRLRSDKRPRPIVLRVNKGQCLQVNLINLLTPDARFQALSPLTREVSLHANGMQWAKGPEDDGSWVGTNGMTAQPQPPPQPPGLTAGINATSTSPIAVSNIAGFPTTGGVIRIDEEYIQYTALSGSQFTGITRGVQGSTPAAHPSGQLVNLFTERGSLVDIGKTKTYLLYGAEVGTFLLYSQGAPLGSTGPGDAGQISTGMFGAVNVQPATAEYYRSQVTRDDLMRASTIQSGRRKVNYSARYPTDGQYDPKQPNRSCGAPILKMVDVQRIEYDEKGNGRCKADPFKDPRLQLYHTDLTAIITGPNADVFKVDPKNPPPQFVPVSASPDRTQPWREVTVIYHEVPTAVQAFREYYAPPQQTSTTLTASISQTSTTPIPVSNTAAFPLAGTLFIDSEYIWYEGKNSASLGTAVVQRGVDGSTSAAHNAKVTVNLFVANLSSVMSAGVDGFSINYGTGGIGSEILANRIKVGPMTNCVECKFEEFFLTAWSSGDPAMAVDRPANTPIRAQTGLSQNITSSSVTPIMIQSSVGFPSSGIVRIDDEFIQYVGVSGNQIGTVSVLRAADCSTATAHNSGVAVNLYFQPDKPNQEVPSDVIKQLACVQTTGKNPVWPNEPQPGAKAQVAFYPDDPSNVYHSYLNDHMKFQILNAGGGISHVHHQHAHQWLHTPDNTNSSYLDSQMISPGAAFTLEMVYDGSGNRNKTAGDSIFHCHFYPHFAAGMWALWRVHDVFEEGTALQSDGLTPQPGFNRVLPDGEISAGTPIPAIVPIPTIAMAPDPAKIQICPVYSDWRIDSFVGDQCVRKPEPVVGYAAVVNKDDIAKNLNPGFPFFIPGIAGHRAPHPPLDFAYETDSYANKVYYDGGLPRHLVLNGDVVIERHTHWDFTKDTYDRTTRKGALLALQLPEGGTQTELVAMRYMGGRIQGTITPKGVDCTQVPPGQPCFFLTNGLPRKPSQGFHAENQYGSQLGAPYADPAVEDGKYSQSIPVGTNIRRYKAAVVEKDVAFSKVGSHYPQQRFELLWQDVMPTMNNLKQVEPFLFRANSKEDIIEFWHTNLVPDYYELDNFQVRTPTDILGQHIHLVKFDVLASDGASNGFNYEDGTLSPDEVRNRIFAIRNGSWRSCPTCPPLRDPQPPPSLICGTSGSNKCHDDWFGAQTTIQRWYPDPLEGCPNGAEGCFGRQKDDRTLRSVFTHDHFGPSTHQQAGLYAGLLVEPERSGWLNAVDGSPLGNRVDGGPTSWQAIIKSPNQADSYREFALMLQDLALAYKNTSAAKITPYPQNAPRFITTLQTPWGWVDCSNNGGNLIGAGCTGTTSTPSQPTPALISNNQGVGTAAVNYRNEPIGSSSSSFMQRVTSQGPNTLATDMSFAFSSIQRATTAGSVNQPNINAQPALGQPVCPPSQSGCPQGSPFVYPGGFAGATGYDPYTPLLRAYQNDKVQVRLLVGAHLFQHSFGMQGIKWLFEPSNSTSGWRDNQVMGISEHFEMLFTVPYSQKTDTTGYFSAPPPAKQIPQGTFFGDYQYVAGQGTRDLQTNGIWGILRAYNVAGAGQLISDLQELPNNDPLKAPVITTDQTCPAGATPRTYYVAAINTQKGLPTDTTPLTITYNTRNSTALTNGSSSGSAVAYVLSNQSGNPQGPLPPTTPLILRAAAGECIQVTLFNNLNPALLSGKGVGNTSPSQWIGLHPQLASFDVTQSNGANTGFNPVNTACPKGTTGCSNSVTYKWYAGNVTINQDGSVTRSPAELGAANLMASDPVNQPSWSLIGALIIEPPASRWCSAANSSNCSGPAPGTPIPDAAVDVSYDGGNSFREFATILQSNLKSGFASVNYGTEPMNYNNSQPNGTPRFNTTSYSMVDLSTSFSNLNQLAFSGTSPAGQCKGDPYTPIFSAEAGKPVRFRMLHPDGKGGFPDSVWTIHGHVWQEEPYVDSCDNPETCPQFTASARLGLNPLSQWMGSRDGFGPGNHFDILIDKAGGSFSVPGDYLYRSYPASGEFINGAWGIFRVLPPGQKTFACPSTTTPAAAALKAPRLLPPGVPPGVAPRPTRNGFERFFPPPEEKPKPEVSNKKSKKK